MVVGQKVALGRVHAGKTVSIDVSETQLVIDYGDGTRTIRRTTDQPVTSRQSPPTPQADRGTAATGVADGPGNGRASCHDHQAGTMSGMHDWLETKGGGPPSPTLVATWLTLGMLPTERVPLWAAHWLANGHDGPALRELAGVHGDDPHEVRDLLPTALADCRVTVPATVTAAAMEAFTDLAQLYANGKAGEAWIANKVDEVVASCHYADAVLALPLGHIYSAVTNGGPDGAAQTPSYVH
jgi:hypothetical protein